MIIGVKRLNDNTDYNTNNRSALLSIILTIIMNIHKLY